MRILNDLSRGRVETLTFLDAIAANINTGSNDTLWPLIGSSYKQNAVLTAYAAARKLTITNGAVPTQHIGGLCPRLRVGLGNTFLAGTDEAAYSFGSATADSAFSAGIWIKAPTLHAADLISKYDAAGTDREWRISMTATGSVTTEFYDESATATEIGTAANILTADEWHQLVVTYDGGQASPVVNIYLDGIAQTAGATTEAGTYVAMEAGDTPLLIGCSGTAAAPVNIFNGWLALPFVTDVQLTGAQVNDIFFNSGVLLGMFEQIA